MKFCFLVLLSLLYKRLKGTKKTEFHYFIFYRKPLNYGMALGMWPWPWTAGLGLDIEWSGLVNITVCRYHITLGYKCPVARMGSTCIVLVHRI